MICAEAEWAVRGAPSLIKLVRPGRAGLGCLEDGVHVGGLWVGGVTAGSWSAARPAPATTELRSSWSATSADVQHGGDQVDAGLQLALIMSTEISTAGVVPRFSSQCAVFLSSGPPTPGPYSVATPSRWSVIIPCRM